MKAITLRKVDSYHSHLQMGKQTFRLSDLTKVNQWWKSNFTLLGDSPVEYIAFPAHLMLSMQTAATKAGLHVAFLLLNSTHIVLKVTWAKWTRINNCYHNNVMNIQQRPLQSQQRKLHGDWKSIGQREE